MSEQRSVARQAADDTALVFARHRDELRAALTLSEKAYNRIRKASQRVAKPTPANVRGAELLKKIYGVSDIELKTDPTKSAAIKARRKLFPFGYGTI